MFDKIINMSRVQIEQLRALATHLENTANESSNDGDEALAAIEDAANVVSKAWSGSTLGYHATVYYEDLQPPPAGAHFSSEWGLMNVMAPGTSGKWMEYTYDAVRGETLSRAGDPDLTSARTAAERCRRAFEDEKSRFDSLISSALKGVSDPYLEGLKKDADDLVNFTVEQGIRVQLPSGQMTTRDAVAASAGQRHAPHQELLGLVVSLRSPVRNCTELARLSRRAADHLELSLAEPPARLVPSGRKVFIGHGRSLQWLKLKDFLQDRLQLEWDEFNRVPVAGVTNIGRLEGMLDEAVVAFLVMTAEDEQANGTTRARENVVHEAGLFQGRLGFMRAIILIEEGCDPFSNIDGLGQIRFATGKIEGAFEQVREVLEREGLVETNRTD